MSITPQRSLDIVAGQVATKATANITNNITINGKDSFETRQKNDSVKISPQSSQGSINREIKNNTSLGESNLETESSPMRFIEPNPYGKDEFGLEGQYPSTTPSRIISQYIPKPCYDFEEQYKNYLIQLVTCEDLKLVANLIDRSGKVIMTLPELVRFIALYGGFPESEVSISLEPIEEVGCFRKKAAFRYRTVKTIKIVQRDFKLLYNNLYNELIDNEKICLETIIE